MLDLPDAGLMHKLSPLEQVGAVVILFQQVEESLIDLVVLSWKHDPNMASPIAEPPVDRRRWCAKSHFSCIAEKARTKTRAHENDPQWQFLFGGGGSLDRMAAARNTWIHSHYDLGRIFAVPGSDGWVMKRTTVEKVRVEPDDPKELPIEGVILYTCEMALSDGSMFRQFRMDQENSMAALSHLIGMYSHEDGCPD